MATYSQAINILQETFKSTFGSASIIRNITVQAAKFPADQKKYEFVIQSVYPQLTGESVPDNSLPSELVITLKMMFPSLSELPVSVSDDASYDSTDTQNGQTSSDTVSSKNDSKVSLTIQPFHTDYNPSKELSESSGSSKTDKSKSDTTYTNDPSTGNTVQSESHGDPQYVSNYRPKKFPDAIENEVATRDHIYHDRMINVREFSVGWNLDWDEVSYPPRAYTDCDLQGYFSIDPEQYRKFADELRNIEPWLHFWSKEDSRLECTIYRSSHWDHPYYQSDVTVSSDLSRFTVQDLRHLYPGLTVHMNPSFFYYGGNSSMEFNQYIGWIPKITGFTREQVIKNVIEYPDVLHCMFREPSTYLPYNQYSTRAELRHNYEVIEVDGELHNLGEEYDQIPDIVPDLACLDLTEENRGFNYFFISEYTCRRYILEEEYHVCEHKYPIVGQVLPFMIVNMPYERYRELNDEFDLSMNLLSDEVSFMKMAMKNRITYWRSTHPIVREAVNEGLSIPE